MEKMTLSIEGMSCGHCVRAVRDALAEVPGVAVERVDVGSATVALDPARSSRTAVEEAVRDAGYDVAAVQAA
jgi:copper chaperone CopZ